MSLQNLIDRKLVSCSAETPLRTVAELMKTENVGAICIVKDGKPEGIVTDRDLAIRCVAIGLDCSKEQVGSIMSKDVKSVAIDDGIKNVFDCMKQSKIRRVVITDNAGKAIGLLSLGDVFDLLMEEMIALRATTRPEMPKIVKKAAA